MKASSRTSRAPVNHRTRVGQERSARTVNRILEAALGVFAERGPDAPVIDDFVQAAGISRGTFYNHFQSVEELLHATSVWTTREVVETIERELDRVDGPVMRLGVGLRLFLARARRAPVWSKFVARVWKVGGLELPLRDVEAGVRRGQFHVPGREAAYDVLLGGLREALQRMGAGDVPAGFPDQVAEVCLQALGVDPRQIAAVLAYDLPADDDGDDRATPAPTTRPKRRGARPNA